MLPAIRGMLNSREQLEQTAAAIRGLDCGTVRIGTFTSVAVHWLPGMIKRFQSEYPKVELKLMNGTTTTWSSGCQRGAWIWASSRCRRG